MDGGKISEKGVKTFLRRKTIFSPLPEPNCRDGIRTDNSPRGDGNEMDVKKGVYYVIVFWDAAGTG